MFSTKPDVHVSVQNYYFFIVYLNPLHSCNNDKLHFFLIVQFVYSTFRLHRHSARVSLTDCRSVQSLYIARRALNELNALISLVERTFGRHSIGPTRKIYAREIQTSFHFENNCKRIFNLRECIKWFVIAIGTHIRDLSSLGRLRCDVTDLFGL